MTESKIVQNAVFSPKIKTYIIVFVAFFLFISIIGIPLLLIWFLGFGRYMSNRYFDNLHCVLTERQLVFSKGVFFKVEKTIPLENIQDLTFLQNPILNALELKILKIETAGGSNLEGSDMKLIGIIEADTFKKRVLIQREKIIHQPTKEKTQLQDPETIALLREMRDLLKDIKGK